MMVPNNGMVFVATADYVGENILGFTVSGPSKMTSKM